MSSCQSNKQAYKTSITKSDITLNTNVAEFPVEYGHNTAFAHSFPCCMLIKPDLLSNLIPEAVGLGGRDGRIRLMFEKKSK